jgi:hydroxymethylglutaryl-CoA lyase
MFEHLPASVSIFEVSLRDGLQNEAKIVPAADKHSLAVSLVGAGLKRIEATSFVSPRWIPQLADADEVARNLPRAPGVCFSALCPNTRGLERAVAAGLPEVAVFLSASETHNQKNTNRSIARSLEVYRELTRLAVQSDIRVRAYISTVWGCPYEGAVDLRRALDMAEQLLGFGCYQVSLGDTIGVGTPKQTATICQAFLRQFKTSQIALHLHDTRGAALANVLVGLEYGIQQFDTSLGGLGGCPYAPGAAGNLATEDLVYLLHGMGIETGIDLVALIESARLASRLLGRSLPGKVHQAGVPVTRRTPSLAPDAQNE